VNFYRSFNSEALLLDTNYLSDLFRRELTDAVARILKVDEVSKSPRVAETVPIMAMHMAAKG
jgi:hypothetical protein